MVVLERFRAERRSGKRSNGLFPALVLLGIHDHCSPALASDGGQLVALLGSFVEAQRLLKQRGCGLSVKGVETLLRRARVRIEALLAGPPLRGAG